MPITAPALIATLTSQFIRWILRQPWENPLFSINASHWNKVEPRSHGRGRSVRCSMWMLIPWVQEHTNCLIVACDPYGTSRTCTRTYLLQLSALILCCQSHIPTFPAPLVLIQARRKLIRRILTQHFTALPTTFDDSFYLIYVIQLKKLSVLIKHLASLPHLQHQVSLCISRHDMCTPASTITATFLNLCYLQEQLGILKTSTQVVFFDILDSNPHRAEVQLKSLMKEVRILTELVISLILSTIL